jgi:lysophospholipase L1-like esterase
MRNARRLWLERALLAAGSLALCLVLLEAGFRIAQELRLRLHEGELWAVYDPELGYRLNPDFEDINAHGLRDHAVSPKGERFRVLVLGDSVAYYGDDLDDTFVGHARRILGERGDTPPLDVLNAGVKGYTTYQELLYLERDGLELRPDLVGVAVVLNDLHRFLHRFRVRDGRILGNSYAFSEEAIGSVDSGLYRLLHRSVFLVWLRHRLGVLVDMAMDASGDGFSFDARPDFRTAWRDEPWHEMEGWLTRMQELGRAHAFGIFLVVFPFGEQYRADYLARDRDYVLKPQRKLGEIAGRLGVPLLDLYPHLDRERDLEPDGIHLTAAGRRRVGARLAGFLEEEHLLPAEPTRHAAAPDTSKEGHAHAP